MDELACLGNGQVPAVVKLAWETLTAGLDVSNSNPEAHTSAPDSVPTVVGSLNQEDGK
jgi:hypothetical protein